MMNRINLKKLLILNIPYILVGLFATNLGEAWRLAEGADSSAKILSFFMSFRLLWAIHFPAFTRWICWWELPVAQGFGLRFI